MIAQIMITNVNSSAYVTMTSPPISKGIPEEKKKNLQESDKKIAKSLDGGQSVVL